MRATVQNIFAKLRVRWSSDSVQVQRTKAPCLSNKKGAQRRLVLLVGVRGFEPPAPASRRQCSTRLSYTPTVRQAIKPGSWEMQGRIRLFDLGNAGGGAARASVKDCCPRR